MRTQLFATVRRSWPGSRAVTAALWVACALSLAAAAEQPGPELEKEETSEPPQREQLDEITVFGDRSLSAIDARVIELENRMYDVFNSLIDDRDYHITCRDVAPLGTRLTQRVCEPGFVQRFGSIGAQAQLGTLQGSGYGGAVPAAMDSEIRIRYPRLQDLMREVATEHPLFLEALLEYVNARDEAQQIRRERCRGRIVCR